MSADAVFAAYPAIPHATAWTELFVVGKEPGEARSCMEMLRADPRATPAWVVGQLKGLVDEDIADGDGSVPMSKLRLIRAEMDRPEYLTYIQGCLGAF